MLQNKVGMLGFPYINLREVTGGHWGLSGRMRHSKVKEDTCRGTKDAFA
jgi:hypothetical protein